MSTVQVFSVHSLLNGYDVISIIPTGSGKSLIIYLYALALPKMLGVKNTMVVVGRFPSSSPFKEMVSHRHAADIVDPTAARESFWMPCFELVNERTDDWFVGGGGGDFKLWCIAHSRRGYQREIPHLVHASRSLSHRFWSAAPQRVVQ